MSEQTYAKRKNAAARPNLNVPAPSAVKAPNSSFSADGASRIDLPEAMRAKMEDAYGADFSNVKIYQSQRVADGGAEAVAMGNTIAFAPGKFDIASQSGQALLGHELSHIVSQGRGEVAGRGVVNDHALEARADREGAMAAAGQQIYSGAVIAPMSAASPAASAGPMQCKKKSGQVHDAEKMWDAGQKDEVRRMFRDNKGLKGKLASMHRSAGSRGKKGAEKFSRRGAMLDYINGPKQFSDSPGTADSPEWAALSQASQGKNEKDIVSTYKVLAGQMKDNASGESRDIINDYIADSRPYNSFLRDGGKRDTPLNQNIGAKVDQLDQAMQPTGADMKTYRGVSSVALRYILQGSGNKALQKAVRKNGSIDYDLLQKNQEQLEGLEFTEKGYSSTSVQESFSEGWRKDLPAREVSTLVNQQIKDKYMKSDLADPESSANGVLKAYGAKDFDSMSAEGQLHMLNSLSTEHFEDADRIRNHLNSQDLFQGHMFEINVPKGTKASMIDKMRKTDSGKDADAGQREMLLGRNTRFKINKMLPMTDEDGNTLKNQFRFLMDVVDQD